MKNNVLSEKFICSDDDLVNYINYYLSFISDLNCEVNIVIENEPLNKYLVKITGFPQKEPVKNKLVKVDSVKSYKYFRNEAIEEIKKKYNINDGYTSNFFFSIYNNKFESTLLFEIYYDESLLKGKTKYNGKN